MAQISAPALYGPVQGAAHQVLHEQGKWKLLEDLDVIDVIKEIGIETILRNFCRFLI
jgi:hypothetical protein